MAKILLFVISVLVGLAGSYFLFLGYFALPVIIHAIQNPESIGVTISVALSVLMLAFSVYSVLISIASLFVYSEKTLKHLAYSSSVILAVFVTNLPCAEFEHERVCEAHGVIALITAYIGFRVIMALRH